MTLTATEARTAYKQTITEKQVQEAIVKAARLHNWHCYHTFDSRRSEPGFPDLVLIRGDRCLVAEIKGPKGHVSPAQATWIDAFQKAGIEAYLLYPDDQDWFIEMLAS